LNISFIKLHLQLSGTGVSCYQNTTGRDGKGRNPLGELVGNPGCQPRLATSFQLVRLVGCGLKQRP